MDPIYLYFDADEQSYLRYSQNSHDSGKPVQVGLANEDGFPPHLLACGEQGICDHRSVATGTNNNDWQLHGSITSSTPGPIPKS